MKVKALASFNDLKAGKLRKTGDTFSITEKRYQELNNTIHGKLIEKIKDKKVIKDVKSN